MFGGRYGIVPESEFANADFTHNPDHQTHFFYIDTLGLGGNSRHWDNAGGLKAVPQRGPATGDLGAKPPEAESFFAA